MKAPKTPWLLFIFLFCVAVVSVEGDGKKDVPPWMEDIKGEGGSTYWIPKGAKRKTIGAQVIVETPNEYVARRLYEMEKYLEERFEKIRERQDSLRKELEGLKKIIDELKNERQAGEEPG